MRLDFAFQKKSRRMEKKKKGKFFGGLAKLLIAVSELDASLLRIPKKVTPDGRLRKLQLVETNPKYSVENVSKIQMI